MSAPLRRSLIFFALIGWGCTTAGESGSAAEWAPAKGPLMTQWAKAVTPENAHREYPRPQFVRKQWTNLNGLWNYALTPASETKAPATFAGQILVPFPIESALSGVMKRVSPGEKLWYSRTFTIPAATREGRLLLHFGAVDWKCEVFVNGKPVGGHVGGYDPFTLDITHALDRSKAEQQLTVAVVDPTDANWQPRGKQVNKPHGIWYTPITGIWQTVWLEPVPKSYIKSLKITPNVDKGEVQVTAQVVGDATEVAFEAFETDGALIRVTAKPGEPATLKFKSPKLWSPSQPHLYDLGIVLAQGDKHLDHVDSYFALRDISLGKDEQGVTRILLNDKFVFQYGPLDQGFWPDGLYTAPSDAALKYDLEVTKKLGFNMVRKHVKVEPARWYHHCDKLGLLVWQDMPNGDRHIGPNDPDIQRVPESVKNYETEWSEILSDFYNSPCIVIWVPFNEGWGQFDTARIADLTRKLDPTRLVNSASGWTDRNVGDMHDIHVYPGPSAPPAESKRAIVLGEFGGLGLPLEGHTWQGKDNWGYRSFTNKEDLGAAYLQLITRLRPLIGKGLSAAVYTQTTDVEIEVNGLMTYDRAVLKFDADKLAAAHAKLYLPPPKVETLVASSQEKPQTWLYTETKPVEGWEKPAFDASMWKEGPGGFGEPSTPGSHVRTRWKSNDIWLRRTFTLESDTFDGVQLWLHHDENTEVYINGVLVAKTTGFTTEYTLFHLEDKALAALKKGDNVIAVHTHQTGGGQYIDVGLVRVRD